MGVDNMQRINQSSDKLFERTFDHSAEQLTAPDGVWERIYDQLVESGHIKTRKKRVWFQSFVMYGSAVALILIFIGVGSYASSSWNLSDHHGNSILQLKPSSSDIPSTYDEKLNQIRSQLEPGEAVAVYIVKDNPNKIVVSLSNPYRYTDVENLKKDFPVDFKTPNLLPIGYSFEYGHIEYHPEYPNLEEIFKEAKRTKQDVVIQKLKLTDKPGSIRLQYSKNGKKEIILVISPLEGEEYYIPDLIHYDIKKVQLSNNEAFVIKKESRIELMWKETDRDQSILYQLFSTDASLEDLIFIGNHMR
jgi:hypothetical protein